MKKLFLIWIILLGVLGLGIAQTQTNYELTFTPEEDCPLAIFAVNAHTEIQTWEEATIKILVTIKTPEIGQEALDEIIKTKRYEVEMTFHEEERVILFEMPKQEEPLILDGYELEEYVEFKIFAPKNIKIGLVTTMIPKFL